MEAMKALKAGQTRIDQHDALHWAWLLLRGSSKKAARESIREKLYELSHGHSVDFSALIEKLREAEG